MNSYQATSAGPLWPLTPRVYTLWLRNLLSKVLPLPNFKTPVSINNMSLYTNLLWFMNKRSAHASWPPTKRPSHWQEWLHGPYVPNSFSQREKRWAMFKGTARVEPVDSLSIRYSGPLPQAPSAAFCFSHNSCICRVGVKVCVQQTYTQVALSFALKLCSRFTA